jgi:hypothetical protein
MTNRYVTQNEQKKKMVGKKFKYYLLLFSCLRDDD